MLLHNLQGRTVDGAPVSLLSWSKVEAVGNSPVSSSPEQANADLLSNKTSSYKGNNMMVALSPAKRSRRNVISSESELNFAASGRSTTLENAPPVKPLVEKQKPPQANIETVLNITEASFYDLLGFQNGSKEYDPLFAYKTKRGLGESEKNTSEVPHPQTSITSDSTSSPVSVTETTTLPTESKTETTTASDSGDEEKRIEKMASPAPPRATNPNEPKNDIKSTKPIKSTQPEPSTNQPNNETGTQSGVDESTTQKESEHETTKSPNTTNENTTEAEGTRNSDKEVESILPGKDNGNTTGVDDTPIVEYENDPKWYGNPKTYIDDYYEVFKQRDCIDFSCKHDFE